jgi:DNA repair photolyase
MIDFFRLLKSDRHVVFCPMNFVADTYRGCPPGCLYRYALLLLPDMQEIW